MVSSCAVEALAARLGYAASLVLLLDYDGTLVPFAPTPELARPDAELIGLLRGLVARPRTEVHVVSGRPARTLEEWLGGLLVGLHAEHGLSSRAPGATAWIHTDLPAQRWRPAALALMRASAARTPGALIEEKVGGIAWHYRLADPVLGHARALALERELARLLLDEPACVVQGVKVVEVVARDMHRGRIVPPLVDRARPNALLVAVGDDATDENLFAALPAGALAVHVGPGASRAPLRLNGVAEVRAVLRALVDPRPR